MQQATGSLLQFIAGLCTQLDESLQGYEKELQDARTAASRFGPPGPVHHLMGKVQHVWNRAGVKQNRIDALVNEKEQVRSQCDRMVTVQITAQQEIGQLRAHNEQLQKENEHLRKELLAAKATPRPAGPPSVSSESSNQSGLADQDQIRKLNATVERIRGEREALRRENAKLRTANDQWRIEADREKLQNDSTIDNLYKRWREAEGQLKRVQRLPSHREMGGHIRLPASDDQASHSATAGDPQRPSVLPIPIDPPAYSDATCSVQALQLAPHPQLVRRPRDPSTRRKKWSRTPRPSPSPRSSEGPKGQGESFSSSQCAP